MDLARIAAATAILGLLESPAQSTPTCGDLQKYLAGTEEPFTGNRGEQIYENKWTPLTSIPGGNCEIVFWAVPAGPSIMCKFDEGAASAVLLSSYRSLTDLVQGCLNGLESRDDWRKRVTSETEFDGQVITKTTWTWTMLRSQTTRQISVSSNSGPTRKTTVSNSAIAVPQPENLLSVIWGHR
jgi:hypothetical protein